MKKIRTSVVFNIQFSHRHIWHFLEVDSSSFLQKGAMALSFLTSEDPEDHSRSEAITLPPIGLLVGLPDRLAGGIHSDRMFY